ncbi:SAV_2336 N-terminal domain-related protein [Kitasatospora sp. NPDC056327]|uniref:SAV_2336 N-terminal domain-related protein n=1 Tax=Kitasatospora sp. NPDC056327 TaxID=3345785 RepID=UPI0035E1219E
MTPSAQEGLRAALAGLLAPADGGAPTPDDLADVLYIAGLAGLGPAPAPGEVPPPAGGGEPSAVDGAQSAEQALPDSSPHRSGTRSEEHGLTVGPRALFYQHGGVPGAGGATGPGNGGPGGGHTVLVTQPTALDGSLDLARALRPLRRLVDAPGRSALDEEATAEASAEANFPVPVHSPGRRPSFSVDLLVDTGVTMAVWYRLAGELYALLERHGAFADVRGWALGTDGEVPTLARFRRLRRCRPAPRPTTAADWARPLKDPAGRRILLVLTDGVGPAWYGDALPGFLAAAVTARPTAVLQVLPRRLWHRTALRTLPVEARASGVNRPIPEFRSEAALPGIPRGARGAEERARVRWLPVLEVAADWLAPWAGLTSGRASGWTPMLASPIDGVPRPPRPTGPAEDQTGPAERVSRFRAGSSPTAYRLTCHLAAAPLSLPVMRLVQRATVPESGQTDLAELFVSGLLEPRGGSTEDPDEQVYDFRPGVRDELLAELTRAESVHVLAHVLAKVSGRVAATFGGTLDFRALATAGGAGAPLPEQSLPFAEVAVAVLAGAGGRYKEVAARLAEAVERTPSGVPDASNPTGGSDASGTSGAPEEAGLPETSDDPGRPVLRRDLLTPVPPVKSPPDPPAVIGRRRELAVLADALSPGRPEESRPDRPTLVVLAGADGTGRRRLVQEYVREHGARHSFVHWVDMRRPGVLELRFRQLWDALSPDGSPFTEASLDRLWAQLARHRDWLLVLDGVPRGAWADGFELPFFLPRHGRGGVVVTTGTVGSWRHPVARIVPVRPLGEDEVFEELTKRLGGMHDPGNPQQERALRRLAQRLPRVPDLLAARDLDAEVAAALTDGAAAPDPRDDAPGSSADGAAGRTGAVEHRTTQFGLTTPLPPRSGVFVGREKELADLTRFVGPVDRGARGYRTALVSGPPGVGKSELVLQIAARVMTHGWYPGGVMYLDLAGNGTRSPLTAQQALTVLLRALGVAPAAVPTGPEDRLVLYRNCLISLSRQDGPVLLVLDNAASAAQVRPLLPVGGTVTALVSARSTLSLDALLYDVGVLSTEDSVALLDQRLRWLRGNDGRIAEAPDRARALAELCDGLPLALTICADLLADSPGRPPASLVDRLTDPRSRLDGLGREGRSVRAALASHVRQLPDGEARLFRLLAAFPHRVVTTEAAARLADLDASTAEDLLGRLALTHLVDAPTWGQWRLRPLIALLATELGNAYTGERAEAVGRLLAHYRSMLEAALADLGPGPSATRSRPSGGVLSWLEAERPVLVPLIRHAALHSGTGAALALAAPLTTLLARGRRFADLAGVVRDVLPALRREEDPAGTAGFLRGLRSEIDRERNRPGTVVTTGERTALADLSELLGRGRPAESVHLAVHVSVGVPAHARTVAAILRGALGAPAGTARTAGDGPDHLLHVHGSADDLATAGSVITYLCERLEAQQVRRRTTVYLALLSGAGAEAGAGADHGPWTRELIRRAALAVNLPEDPPVVVAVDPAVLGLLGDEVAAGFTAVPGRQPDPGGGTTLHVYTGDALVLAHRLAHPAGPADGG